MDDHTDWILDMKFRPDGRTLATGSQDGTVRLWDVESQRLIGEPLDGRQRGTPSIAFSPDGGTLATAFRDDTVLLWDLKNGQIRKRLTGHTDDVLAVAFTPDGRTLASGGRDDTVRLWHGQT
jgi:WD40 repeat protein